MIDQRLDRNPVVGAPRPMIDTVFTGAESGLSPEGTFEALRNIVNDLSNEEIKTANANFKPSSLYGYGNPALSYRGEEFPWLANADERDMPANQDTLDWHFYNTPVFADTVDFHNQATPEQKAQLAREFTLLRNANDWRRGQNIDDLAEQYRQENLYGTALQDILEQSEQGRTILDGLPPALKEKVERTKHNRLCKS